MPAPPQVGEFKQPSEFTCYSDFAHLTDPTVVTYVLGLGNDGIDKEKLLAAKAAAKKRAEAAKALLAPVAAPTVDESGHPVKPPEPCRRTGCKDLERRLKQREETILDERGELAEMCQQLSQKLMVLEEQVAESERTNQTLEARSRAMKEHIAQTKEHTENLRTEAGVIKHQNVTIQNQIMHLELELQRGHAEARQAQADMVKAMWYKDGDSSSTAGIGAGATLPALSPITPLVTRSEKSARRIANRKMKRGPPGVRKYSGLVRNSLKDSSEIDTVVTEPNPSSSLFSRPSTSQGFSRSSDVWGRRPGTASIDLRTRYSGYQMDNKSIVSTLGSMDGTVRPRTSGTRARSAPGGMYGIWR